MPSKDGPKYCFDTCTLLDALSKRSVNQASSAERLLKEAESGQVQAVISTVTIAEIHHIRNFDAARSEELITAFFDNDYLEVWHVDDEVAKSTREIRRHCQFDRSQPIKIADAIVLATAVVSKSQILFTRDGTGKDNKSPLLDLDRVFGDPKIRIVTPSQFVAELEEKTRLYADAKTPLFTPPNV